MQALQHSPTEQYSPENDQEDALSQPAENALFQPAENDPFRPAEHIGDSYNPPPSVSSAVPVNCAHLSRYCAVSLSLTVSVLSHCLCAVSLSVTVSVALTVLSHAKMYLDTPSLRLLEHATCLQNSSPAQCLTQIVPCVRLTCAAAGPVTSLGGALH